MRVQATLHSFLDDGGKMGALMRTYDWSRSPLGPPACWPDTLKAAIATCLASRFPMVVWWGPDLLMLYNDVWQPILGETKHPSGLGRPAAEVWPETWPIVRQQFEDALNGKASWSENRLLASDRHGFFEECYFTYSHSPLRDAEGKVVGVQTAVIETTDRVLSERRMLILRALSNATLEEASQGQPIGYTCQALLDLLCKGNPDVPFAAQYVLEDGARARLICSGGIDRSLLPSTISAMDCDPWGISQVLRERVPAVSERPKSASQPLPGGAWPEPTRQLVALPLVRKSSENDLLGVILVGVNSRLRLDRSYMDFLNLIAAELAGSIARIQGMNKEMHDLAALKRTEAALRTSEARLAEEAVALARLHDYSSQLWRRDLNDGLVVILRGSIEMMGADKGTVQIIDPRGVLTIAVQEGFDQPFLEFFKEVPIADNSAYGRALCAGRRVIVEDVDTDEDFAPFRHIALAAGFRAVQSTPIMGRNGEPLGMMSTHFCNAHRPSEQELRILDLYARKAADFIEHHQSDEVLRQSKERYKGIFENAGTGIYIADLTGRFQHCNPAYASIHGYTEEELRELSIKDLVHPEDWPRHIPEIELLTSGKIPSFKILNRCIAKGGDLIWVHKHVSLLRDAAGRPESILALVTDVTERKRAEDARKFLNAELDHRVKNTLATVSAVVSHTGQGSRSVASFVAALDGRIRSMATTHELLSARRWQGISLTELVRRELAPYATRDNTEISGPEVILKPEAGQAMAMVLHELATNAAKYGALSTRKGRVPIRWAQRLNGQPGLVLEWQEIGGPAVVASDKSSFGMSTIRDLIPYEFGGTVDHTFAPEGVRCRVELPADWLTSHDEANAEVVADAVQRTGKARP
jgi:PAS domain S-box-containing protein